MTMVNGAFLHMFELFCLSIRRLENVRQRPKLIEKIAFICVDYAALDRCRLDPRRRCVYDPSFSVVDGNDLAASREFNYHDDHNNMGGVFDATRHYSRLTARKAELVLLGLRQGLSVLWTDLDVIWHKDPLPFVLAHPAELQLSGMRCYNASQTTTQLCKNEVNSGIYFARATPLALRFFEDWVDGTPDHRKVGFKFCSQSDCPDLAINDEHHYLGNLPHEDQPRLAKLFGNFKRQSATANFSQVVHDPTFFPGMLEVNMQRSPGCDSYFLHAAGFVGNLTKLKLMCDHLCAYDHKCLSPAERLLPESQKEYCEFARKLLPLKGKPQRPPG